MRWTSRSLFCGLWMLTAACGSSAKVDPASSADAAADLASGDGQGAGGDAVQVGDVASDGAATADTGAVALPGADLQAYVPVVDQWNVQTFSVSSDHPGPLMVGHPVRLRVEVDVSAQPYRTDAWYGLKSADDKTFCVIDHVAIDHLGAMFEAAERLHSIPPASDVPEPSLQDCHGGATCPTGETCTAMQTQAIDGTAPDIAALKDPNGQVAQVAETGDAPPAATTHTDTVYVCATPEWVQRTRSPPAWVTPGDLAGTVHQLEMFGAEDEVPAACAPLVGQSGVTAWVAFDPEELTLFAQRPATPAYHLTDATDAGSTDVPTPGDAAWTPDQFQSTEAQRAFAERLPVSVPVTVVADAGLDLDLRTLTTGSSVLTVNASPRPAGDLLVELAYSLDGQPTPAQVAALQNADVQIHATLVPVGAPRAGCTPTEGLDPGDPMPLEMVHADATAGAASTGSFVYAEPLHKLAPGVQHSQPLMLEFPSEVRQVLTEQWACWDRFEVQACATSTLPESEMPQDDNCAATQVLLLRESPPVDAEILDDPFTLPPPPLPPPPPPATCDQSLLKQYGDLMKKHLELENAMHISDYYTFDIVDWMGSKVYPPGFGPGRYITDWNRWKMYMAHLKSFLTSCEQQGEQKCWETWGYKYSPWDIDLYQYQKEFIPYFYNPWAGITHIINFGGTEISVTGKQGHYQRYKTEPQAFVRDWFSYDCPGIETGTICSEIGYDLTKVPQLAARIRDVVVNKKVNDPLMFKFRSTEPRRCLNNSLSPLRRISVDAAGKVTEIPDDNTFYTTYLTHVCTKGKYKAEADKVWAQIVSQCSNVAKPFPDSGTGISTGRFVPELYKVYDTGYSLGVKGVAEGGILNDYAVDNASGAFKLQFGTQGRIYLQTEPGSVVSGWLDIMDIFKVWLVGNFYSDVLSSNVEAGFHVMTNDIWKITYKIPQGEFELPNPPELAKEKEKCKYIFKPPFPFRIELCGSLGGKVFLNVGAKVLKSGLEGTSTMDTTWPGVSGTVTPGVAITTGGRAGIDVWVASAGIAIKLDPTFEVSIPVTIGAKWNLTFLSKVLSFTLKPFVTAELKLRALGGELAAYARWKIGSGSEEQFTLFDWDPIDIGELVGKKFTLVEHNWSTTGKINF